jgi:predicted RNase H-like HicB family nuclease
VKIKVVIWQGDNVWCGSVPALPGCHTWGDSYEHLLEMLKDAIQGWLEVANYTHIKFILATKNKFDNTNPIGMIDRASI